MVTTIKQTIDKTEILINMTINGTTAFTVTDVKGGLYDIEVAYKALSLKTYFPGGRSIAFDSGLLSPDSSEQRQQMDGEKCISIGKHVNVGG